MSMRTFVLLQCILQTSALRSQASPSRQGSLTATRKRGIELTTDKIDSCDEEDLRIHMAVIAPTQSVTVGELDEMDRFIKKHIKEIALNIEHARSHMSTSENNCPTVQAQLALLGTIPEKFKKAAENAIQEMKDKNSEEEFLSLMDEKQEDVELNEDEEEAWWDTIEELKAQFKEQLSCADSGTGPPYEDTIQRCEEAQEFLEKFSEKKEREKAVVKAGSKMYEGLIMDMHRKQDGVDKMNEQSTKLDTKLKSIMGELTQKIDASQKLSPQMEKIQEALTSVGEKLVAIDTESDIISSLYSTAKELSTAVENIMTRTQRIISQALIYHHNSVHELSKWYKQKPKETFIDSSVLQKKFSSLEKSCIEYQELDVAVQMQDLMVSGTPVLQHLTDDLVNVISTNDICESMKTLSLEQYLKHFNMQMHREWVRNMRKIEQASNSLKRISSPNTKESDLEKSIDMYLRAFTSGNKFYNSYLKFWRKYFMAIYKLVNKMHDDVESMDKAIRSTQSDEKSKHQALQNQFEDIQQKLKELQDQIEKHKEDQKITSQAKTELTKQIEECYDEIRKLKEMGDKQQEKNLQLIDQYRGMLKQQASLLTLRMSKFSLG